MIHPDTELRFVSNEVGYGVFATRLIRKGTVTYAVDPLEISMSKRKYKTFKNQWKSVIDKYAYMDGKGNRLISWDIAKYVNHCCHCNTMSTGWGFEIALKDIQAGEEITDEYGLFNVDCEMKLHCPKQDCRGIVRFDDILRYHDEWDNKIKQALTDFFSVDQPLMELLNKRTLTDIREWNKGKETYRSVLNLYSGKRKRAAAV